MDPNYPEYVVQHWTVRVIEKPEDGVSMEMAFSVKRRDGEEPDPENLNVGWGTLEKLWKVFPNLQALAKERNVCVEDTHWLEDISFRGDTRKFGLGSCVYMNDGTAHYTVIDKYAIPPPSPEGPDTGKTFEQVVEEYYAEASIRRAASGQG